MRRYRKYLNAREYAERLRLADNFDVAEFAEEFLYVLDFYEDSGIEKVQEMITAYSENAPDNAVTDAEKVEWMGKGSDLLLEIEGLIEEKCPEYAGMDTDEIIKDMLTRLRPKQEYDL